MKNEERRRWSRRAVPEPELAMIRDHAGVGADYSRVGIPFRPLFVGVHNLSPGGLLIETATGMPLRSRHLISLYDFGCRQWRHHPGEVVWTDAADSANKWMCGIHFLTSETAAEPDLSLPPPSLLADLEFLLNTELLLAIPRHAVWSLLNYLKPREVQPGERFIRQGDEGDSLYIIREGSCSVRLEKEGTTHSLAQLGTGDVVGEMAVLTGEPRNADVVADTRLRAWMLVKGEFEQVSSEYPDLRMFLTEILTRRLENTALTADRTIGRYLIKLKLAHGGWGIIYQGVHKTLNMPVAIKMLKHQMAMDPDFQQKFRQEAEVIAQLNHANIVHVHDIEERYRTIFIIMEFLEGESLENLLKRAGPLPQEQAVDLLVQVSRGLAYAHRKGIIHQDIKPANLYVQQDGQLKILDFGLACSPGVDELSMMGTIYYAAPEQINGEVVDVRTDIYCLGITAYEMVTGRRPYPEDDLMTLMDLHLEEDIPDPGEAVPGLVEGLRRFILKACRRPPEARYRSMDEALEDLLPLYRGITAEHDGGGKKRMAAMFLFYEEGQLGRVNELLDEFGNKAVEEGITFKAAEFRDV